MSNFPKKPIMGARSSSSAIPIEPHNSSPPEPENIQPSIREVRKQRSYHTSDGWHSRGYLPHFDQGGNTQFVTIRLNDSVPQERIRQIEAELKYLPNNLRSTEKRRRIETLLDHGLGECHLAQSNIADLVEESIFHIHSRFCTIHDWVIMPNHLHLLLTVLQSTTLSLLLQSFKSYTGRRANLLLGSSGAFWFPEYYDRYIRDAHHFDTVIAYIEQNPVKAGLCEKAKDWRYSSAFRGKVAS